MISMPCPHCQHQLSVTDKERGRIISCSRCQQMVTVPTDLASDLPTAKQPSESPTVSSPSYVEQIYPRQDGDETQMPSEPPKPAIPIGPTLVPGFSIVEELGRGGMGVVYKAKHLKLNRIVSLKMILAGGHAKSEDLARFVGEAEAACAVFSPRDGNILATAGDDAVVRLWNLKTRVQEQKLPMHARVNAVAFSPDGKLLASANSDHVLVVWNRTTQRRREFRGHDTPVIAVRFSPDGKTLASGSAGANIKLWEVATGEVRATMKGHSGIIHDLAFSPDGKSLASGSVDRMVKLWDVASGQERATFLGHTRLVYSVAFSPDGTILASDWSPP